MTATETEVETTSLTILFGSQTGNAEYLAHEIHEEAADGGLESDVMSLEEWLHGGPRALDRLLVVTSTHDNGHMPDNAAEFFDWISGLEPGALEGLPYAVLSIGDSMYEGFCKAGHDIDKRLEELGAQRAIDGVDCDIDFEFSAGKWATGAITALAAAEPWSSETETPEPSAETAGGTAQPDKRHSARISASRKLSKPGSGKSIVHYELAFDDGPFNYEPGDSIGVFPFNSAELVSEWLTAFGAEEALLGDHGLERPVREILRTDVELRIPHPGLLVSLSRLRPNSVNIQEAVHLIQSGERSALDNWLWGLDVLDVLIRLECTDLPIELVLSELRPLQHRAYSISSSPIKDDGSLHITVSGIEYLANQRAHVGAATSFLADHARSGEPFEVRRLPAHEFRLPADDAPVIMIGPGVGVAPFRAFLRHRDACGAKGPNWLFFGGQHRDVDWLYEDDFTTLVDCGVLDRLDVAFSRDGREKHYVQHDMLSNANEIRHWIDHGAYIFVCGDKKRMASDVDQALLKILSGSVGEEGAHTALNELRSSARYVKDVY